MSNFLRKPNYAQASVIALLSLLIVTFSSITFVRANPLTVNINPTSGSYGTSVHVYGNDSTPDGEVRVYFANFLLGFFSATTTANSTGEYSTNISVPAFPAGFYSILVHDISTGDITSLPFTIIPKIVLSTNEGSCSDEVAVQGYGFMAVNPVTLEMNGIDVTPWLPPQTDDFGSFESTFRIPRLPNGTYNLNASDGIRFSLAPVTVLAKITVTPTSGGEGVTVFVNGTGFTPASYVSIQFDHLNVTMYRSLPIGFDGSFMQLFFVPDVPNGEYSVTAMDASGNSAQAKFLVPSPILTLEPDTTFGSTIITAKGFGFPPYQPVLLYLEGNMVLDLLDLMVGSQALYANEDGTYEYTFTTPVTKPGVYQVTAYSSAGFGFTKDKVLASASLTITDAAILHEIKDKIATIIIPDLGIIKENLSSIDAHLIKLEGDTAIINSTLGVLHANIDDIIMNVTKLNEELVTIQTTLGIIEGKIDSVDGKTVTIETDMGTIMTDISNIKESQATLPIPLYIGLISALTAAIGTIYLAIIHVRAMRKTSQG
ncbi:MAG: hypothetical protein PVF96_08710 [Candidatus Bathyarchaeota archaeon]